MILRAIAIALENMDQNFLELSRLDLSETGNVLPVIREAKVLERPFAYEFYHQMRMLRADQQFGTLFDGVVLQGEVAKRYQGVDRMPDFILHRPNSHEKNLAAIEFKLGSAGVEAIKDDLNKLESEFGRIGYKHLVEVVLGPTSLLRRANCRAIADCPRVTIVAFDTTEWRATEARPCTTSCWS